MSKACSFALPDRSQKTCVRLAFCFASAALSSPTSEEVDNFFQAVEARATLPETELADLVPADILQEWRRVGDTQSAMGLGHAG